MKKRQLLYATTNPGKIFEVGKFLRQFGIELVSPSDIGLSLDVSENEETLEENAMSKAKTYLDAAADYLVMADDTGIEIDALDKKPGIHVRRWKDGKTRMSDQEIIDFCLFKMKGIPLNKRSAQFRTVVALGVAGKKIEFFEGSLRGTILEKPMPLRIKGFPFESLFYVPEWNMVLGEAHTLPTHEKNNFLSHRERAVMNALPRIKNLLGIAN